MNVLEPKGSSEIDDKIRELLFTLRYKNNPIFLVGSSSFKYHRYFGDYDCVTAIDREDGAEKVYDVFNKIMGKIEKDPDVYFIELKIQTKEGKKIRYYVGDKLDLKSIQDNFKNIEFIKIDLLVWFDYHFTEMSIIYTFFAGIPSKNEMIGDIKDEMDEYKNDGMFFKALKRKFLIYKIEGNDAMLRKLTNIFNSELGLKYKLTSNIDAMILALKYYDDKHTRERVKTNLKYLKLEKYKLSELEKHSEELKKSLNEETKKKYHLLL